MCACLCPPNPDILSAFAIGGVSIPSFVIRPSCLIYLQPSVTGGRGGGMEDYFFDLPFTSQRVTFTRQRFGVGEVTLEALETMRRSNII